MKDAPTTTLTNGLRVANFSSPHQFTFEDQTVLKACDRERSQALSMTANEVLTQNPANESVYDVNLSFVLTPVVLSQLGWLDDQDDVDVVIAPLPVISALKEANIPLGKARTIRMVNRQEKIASCNKFCK
jgi:hypothetical protein